ncbi:hypothetical protein [Vitreimonas sp.]|uniref:hypothetical protein n=1 Tax=Vitreimonas sp. TaxID=3069702 RepID=UPI002ED86F2B
MAHHWPNTDGGDVSSERYSLFVHGVLQDAFDLRGDAKKRGAVAVFQFDEPGRIASGQIVRIGSREWQVVGQEHGPPATSVGVLLAGATAAELRSLIGQTALVLDG